MKISTFLKLLFLTVIFFVSKPLMATTLRINNNLATDKTNRIYASLQEANDDIATKSGDTLLVEGSIKIYADLNCTKKLVIIGTGYFLTQNTGQANSISSTVQNLNFKSGSEGSIIIGLLFSSNSSLYAPHVSVNGISVIRCYLTNGIFIEASINSIVILQNYFPQYSNGIYFSSSLFTFSGGVLKSNIINSSISVDNYINYPRVFAVCDHNIFLYDIQISTTSFRSNIIASASTNINITSPSIQNNITLGTQLNPYATNQSYKDNTQLFVGLTAANNKSPDGQYKLIAGNAFATAGYNNEEPGIFGGTEPYVLSGIPTIPTIYELQADAVANKQDGLNVTIKARANP